MILSFVLTSCWNNTEDTSVVEDNTPVVEDNTNNDSNTEDNIPVINNNTDTTVIDDKSTDTWRNSDITPETNSADEEILEDEVNALLDEFIDSLDNYDK